MKGKSLRAARSLKNKNILKDFSIALDEYFTYSVCVESKLENNPIVNLEVHWEISGLFYCCCLSQMLQASFLVVNHYVLRMHR